MSDKGDWSQLDTSVMVTVSYAVAMMLFVLLAVQDSVHIPWYQNGTFLVGVAAALFALLALIPPAWRWYRRRWALSMSLYLGGYPPEGNLGRAKSKRRPVQILARANQRFVARIEPKVGQGGLVEQFNVRFINWPWFWFLERPIVRNVVLYAPHWMEYSVVKSQSDTQSGWHVVLEKPMSWVETDPICLEIDADSAVAWLGRVSVRAHIGARRPRVRRRVHFR